jgi:transcriptional regulator with XRE-family HTH domain
MSIENIIGVPIPVVNRNSDLVSNQNIGMTIGERIRSTRKEIGMGQTELGKKAGMSQSALSEVENGDSASTSKLPSIAAALGVNALWLETGKGPKHAIKNISARELQLVIAYREASDEGRTFIEMACSSAPKREP